jgi:hypothetical protein
LTKVAVVDRYHRNEFVYKNEGVGAIVKWCHSDQQGHFLMSCRQDATKCY